MTSELVEKLKEKTRDDDQRSDDTRLKDRLWLLFLVYALQAEGLTPTVRGLEAIARGLACTSYFSGNDAKSDLLRDDLESLARAGLIELDQHIMYTRILLARGSAERVRELLKLLRGKSTLLKKLRELGVLRRVSRLP